MGKLVLLIHVSANGYMAGPNGEIDWLIFDEELNDYVTGIRRNVDATVYGRVTYQIMESYWPQVVKNQAPAAQIDYAEWVDRTLKVVVSTTLDSVQWNNTKLVKDNVAAEISQLKKELKGDLLLLGSARLAQSLQEAGLIDEYRITVNPAILGSGIPMLHDVKNMSALRLLEVQTFNNGVVALHYEKK